MRFTTPVDESTSFDRIILMMPIRNAARHLPRVLESISNQSLSHKRLYLIVVDGDSDDGNREIAERFLRASDVAGRVIDNPRRKIPIALNLALELTSNRDVIVRLDGHTVYGKTYLEDAVSALLGAPEDVACVGCAQRPAPSSDFQERVVGALYTNPMGLGGADFRVGDDIREVENIYLGVWRPGVFQQVGGFDETLDANEDAEHSARIRRSGLRILRLPLPCECYIKRTIYTSITQWHRYSYWRARMLLRNPTCARLRHIVTPLAAIAVLALCCLKQWLVLSACFVVYGILVLRSRRRDEHPLVTLATLAYFPIVQLAFALGMFRAAGAALWVLLTLLAERIAKRSEIAKPSAPSID